LNANKQKYSVERVISDGDALASGATNCRSVPGLRGIAGVSSDVSERENYVVFLLDAKRYALYLKAVERVVHAVEVTPLAKAPDVVLGIVSLHGRIVPVFDPRRRFRLPEREASTADQIIFAYAGHRMVALWVDSVVGVIECAASKLTHAGNILPGMNYVQGVFQLEDGLVLVHDLDSFLSLEETNALDCALEASAPP
jgi:purine-binding chemotaxis protein CheW